MHRIVLLARAGQRPEVVDAFLKSEVFPALAKDWHIGDLSTYVTREGGVPTYVVQVDVRSWGEPNSSLALDVLAGERGTKQADAIREQLQKMFDARTAKVLYLEPQLSLSREIMGKSGGGVKR